MIQEDFIDSQNIKEESGYKFTQFIFSLGYRFKNFYDNLIWKMNDYRSHLESGGDESWGINGKQRDILLSGSTRDLSIINGIKTILENMTIRLEQGIDDSDYDTLSRFSNAFLAGTEEMGKPKNNNIVESITDLLDSIELKSRLFLNCCFIKNFEYAIKNMDFNEFMMSIQSDDGIPPKEYNDRLDTLEKRLNEIMDKLSGVSMTLDFGQVDRSKSLMESSVSINNIFKNFDFSVEGVKTMPQVFKDLLEEWELELEMQCNLVDRVLEKKISDNEGV